MDYQKLLEEIKSKIDIVDFVSDYLNLTKTGQNYKALCPFHSEKTPSFFISPTKQIFHCFGCGKGGDIVSFVMEYEKVSFNEALSILAAKAGIELKGFQTSSSGIKDKLYRIYELSTEFFRERLKNSAKAKKYLSERGISSEIVEQFGIGYASDERDGLYKFLINEGFDDRLIRLSGLVHNGVDFFRNRIMIPIHDLSGRVIAFGGRLIDSTQDLPKYINSSDTPIFKKGENLYGLWQAKQQIKQKGYAILMEGYIDVIMSHQFGFRNAIAPLGTSLTLEQLKRLRRFTNKIVISFDGDEAGILAAQRSLSLLFQAGFFVKVALLPEGQDPASLLQKKGERAFKMTISKALSPIEFALQTSSKKSKSDTVQEILERVCYVKNLIYRDELIKELAERTSISELALREELKKVLNKRREEFSAQRNGKTCFLGEEETLLKIALSFPEKLNSIFSEITLEHFENPIIRELIKKLQIYWKSNTFEQNNQIPFDKLLNDLSEEEKKFLSKLIISAEIDPESVTKNLNDCIKRLKLKHIDRQIKTLSKSADERLLQSLIKQKKEILSG